MKLLAVESSVVPEPKKIYNLKEEYNWRGDVAELLAKHHYGPEGPKVTIFEGNLGFPRRRTPS